MKSLISMGLTGVVLLSGCAVSNSSAPTASAPLMSPLERQAEFESQAKTIRTRIVQLKQQVVVQEVMLVNVERRAAMSQFVLSNLPNTEVLSEPAPAVAVSRLETDRLSVAVRPAPTATLVTPATPVTSAKSTKSVTNPAVKKMKKPVKKASRPAPSTR